MEFLSTHLDELSGKQFKSFLPILKLHKSVSFKTGQKGLAEEVFNGILVSFLTLLRCFKYLFWMVTMNNIRMIGSLKMDATSLTL